MSLETWKKEFYPTRALDTTQEDAATHALKKWQGMTEENLERHSVKADSREGVVDIVDESISLKMNTTTCALCVHHYEPVDEGDGENCTTCPLYQYLDDISCGNDDDDPYSIWYDTHDPWPLIEALQAVVKNHEAEGKDGGAA